MHIHTHLERQERVRSGRDTKAQLRLSYASQTSPVKEKEVLKRSESSPFDSVQICTEEALAKSRNGNSTTSYVIQNCWLQL